MKQQDFLGATMTRPGLDITIRIAVDGTDKRALHDVIAQALLMLRLNHFGDVPLSVPTPDQVVRTTTINNGAAQLEALVTVQRRQ